MNNFNVVSQNFLFVRNQPHFQQRYQCSTTQKLIMAMGYKEHYQKPSIFQPSLNLYFSLVQKDLALFPQIQNQRLAEYHLIYSRFFPKLNGE